MPKKSLEEMLAENTVRPEVKAVAKRQAIFLAYWDEIESAFRKGWSYVDIWEALKREGIIDFGYPTFMHYKDKKKRREKAKEEEAAKRTADEAQGERGETPRSPLPPKVPGLSKGELPVFGSTTRREPKRF